MLLNPFVHYVITFEALKDRKIALYSFACDLDPAKELLHRKLYFEGGVLDLIHNLPLNDMERRGTLAHIIQDAVWDAFFRDAIRGDNIWIHRMHETFWTRRFFENRKLPKIELSKILPFLRKFGDVDLDGVRRNIDRLYWIILADEDEVLRFYWNLIGHKISLRKFIINDDIIKKFIRMTKMLIQASEI